MLPNRESGYGDTMQKACNAHGTGTHMTPRAKTDPTNANAYSGQRRPAAQPVVKLMTPHGDALHLRKRYQLCYALLRVYLQTKRAKF